MRDKNIIAVFSIDAKHNKNSKALIGLFENKDMAIKILIPTLKNVCDEDFADMGYNTSKELLNELIDSLKENDQTNHLSENYVIESKLLNELFL